MNLRAAAVAVLLASGTAAADKQTDANDLFAKGQTQYLVGEYRAAIKLFDDAYQLVRDPVYLFNIAQSYRKLFDCVPAAEYFTRFLTEATDINKQQRATVEQLLHELAPCVSDRKASAVQQNKSLTEPVAPEKRVPDPGRNYRIAGIASAGAGAIGLVIGIAYGKRGADLEAELADCKLACDWTDEREATDRAGRRANVIAAISWIAGGAALATGATLYILGYSKRRRFEVSASATSGVAVAARFSF